MRGAVALKFTY